MPLPQDERIVSLSNRILEQFDKVFGVHPGFRPAHAKGVLLSGHFTPAEGARRLTKAPHALRATTPVSVRFSNSTGLPAIPDNVPDANPRGLAVRFHLEEHVHTDIVSHSTDGFPTHHGEDFLALLEAVAASGADVPSPKPVEKFLASHPAALAFVQTPKPFPASFASETYFGVVAYKFSNEAGETRFGRYRIIPERGNEYLSDDQVAKLPADYHFDEIVKRVGSAPIRFTIVVQIAGPQDKTDDATVHWPSDREVLELGTLQITDVIPDNVAQQQQIIFDPIPRVDGIEPSDDPLLELRAAVYLLSGRRRRKASVAQAAG